MQTILLCRFSYPAEGGFQVDHDSIEARRAFLYNPDRMAERFHLFEHLCLPGLKAQTDPDFSFIVLTGACLPDRYRDRLLSLLADVPQAHVVTRDPGPHRLMCQSVLNAARRHIHQPCLQVRHDDDDALAIDFIARLKKAATDCSALLRDNRLVGFDWNRGFTLRTATSSPFEISETVTPYLGVAQAVAVQGGVKQSLMNFAHSRINRYMPTVTFTDQPMFLRAHHKHNDSRQGRGAGQIEFFEPTLDDIETLHRRFGLTADALAQAFSGAASIAPHAIS